MEKVKQRLEILGYRVKKSDGFMLDFCIQKTEEYIKSELNVYSVPEELFHTAVDMVCGEFLFLKKSSGFPLTGINLETDMIKSVHEGDTALQFFEGCSPEKRLDKLIDFLINNGKERLLNYRKLKWN
jgi:hypothetical protein